MIAPVRNPVPLEGGVRALNTVKGEQVDGPKNTLFPRTTKSDTAMASTSMAVTVGRKPEDNDTEWFRLVAFGRQADALCRHQKGDLVGIMGGLSRERWIGNDGVERTAWSVVVDAVMSAQTVRPRGGGKRSENGIGDEVRRADASTQAPFDDSIPFLRARR